MDYPRYVFLSPGKHECQGGSYDCEVVHGREAHDAALSAGYSDSIPEAMEAARKAKEGFVATPKAVDVPEAVEEPAGLFEPQDEAKDEPKAIEQPRKRGRPARS